MDSRWPVLHFLEVVWPSIGSLGVAGNEEFPGQTQNHEPIQLTAGPLDFQFALPAKYRDEIFTIGTAYRAEVVRYNKNETNLYPICRLSRPRVCHFLAMDNGWPTSVPRRPCMAEQSGWQREDTAHLSSYGAGEPRWSPDGKQIAFFAVVPGGVMNIYVIPSAGGSAEHLLPSDRGSWMSTGPRTEIARFGTAVDFTGSIHIIDLSSRRVSTLPGSMGFFRLTGLRMAIHSWHDIQSEKLMFFDTATQSWTCV